MNILLIGILLCMLLQLALGYVVFRSIRTEDDYLLAGRKLGYVLATFSIFATWFGAESCIGTAGAARSGGGDRRVHVNLYLACKSLLFKAF